MQDRAILIPGIPRSYNVVEIDSEKMTGRVHQRQMVNDQFQMPVWGPGHFISSNSSFFDFELSRPLTKRPIILDSQLSLEHVDRYIGSHQWKEALEILEPIKNNPQARLFLVQALEELGDDRRTNSHIVASPNEQRNNNSWWSNYRQWYKGRG